jgi:glutamate-1-semialdehyde 2,1-aminomutase
MMALRMVRAYTGKKRVVKFEGHFHGWNDYMMAGGTGLGGIPQETLNTMIVLPPNDISIVEKILKENDDIAAIILEPTGAHMGMHPIKPSFLNELRDVTERHQVVLIFDEVVTGFRISMGGAQEYYGVKPDMTTLAKILGGGLPGGAVVGKADIIDMIGAEDDPDHNHNRRIYHPGTFNANPLSAAAGAKALELLATTDVNDTANARATKLKTGLNDLLSKMEVPGCAYGLASIVMLRLGVDHDCDQEVCILPPEKAHLASNPDRTSQLNLSLLNHGVHSGTRFILMAAHREEDIDDTIDAMEKSLTEIRGLGLV